MGNIETGELLSEEELNRRPISEQAKFRLIPEKYREMLETMNREKRRKWMRDNKKLLNVEFT